MSFGAEVTGKLGIDTSSVAGDLEKGKQVFRRFGQDVEQAGAEHGANTGQKLGEALEHRLLGSRHISGALATALGLNIEKLAEGVTAALVGGTKEAWAKMGELADENAKLIEQRIERAMTPKGLEDKHKADLQRAIAEFNAEKARQDEEEQKRAEALKKNAAVGLADAGQQDPHEAEKKIALAEKEKAIHEAELKVQGDQLKNKAADQKISESVLHTDLTGLTSQEKVAALEEEKLALIKQQQSGKLTVAEIDERAGAIREIENKINAEIFERGQKEIEQKRELLRLNTSLAEAQRKRNSDEEALANKRNDRGKETIGEIAALSGKRTAPAASTGPVDTFGLSAEAAAAKEQAVEIQRQQAEAERLRKSGDVGGANALFDQISASKQKLVDSGFAKSTEGDDMKQLKEQLQKDNEAITKVLTEIRQVAQGKIKNQK